MDLNRIVASSCSNPKMNLDGVLAAHAGLGYRKFEAFTGWAASALDIDADPDAYVRKAASHGIRFASCHLPAVTDDYDASLARSIHAAHFAEGIGAPIVLFKASSRDNYIKAAAAFLDAIAGLSVTSVLQNHAGTAITTLDDFREVIAGINDTRMKTLLEVGHFHAVGVSWRRGCELLGDSIALIHVKDMKGAQSVPFGTGEVDLAGLVRHMQARGYEGDYVVEMEVKDAENTIRYLGDALHYLLEIG
ncbi:MAG TPA: TIM barrel protein [Planctomycetota bacterium]|nr:TIM barrel protein [Planctomycetota bacterium]